MSEKHHGPEAPEMELHIEFKLSNAVKNLNS